MINLIPNEQKKKMVRSFYYRLAIVFLLTLSFSILIGVVVMLPSYFLTYSKVELTQKKLEIQKEESVPEPDQRTILLIKELDAKLSLIERVAGKQFNVSKKVINAIILKKIPSIKITNISYENDPVKGQKIGIEGAAPSREILLSFRRALEDDTLFKQVDLPISNFVKGSNIRFYLSLIPS